MSIRKGMPKAVLLINVRILSRLISIECVESSYKPFKAQTLKYYFTKRANHPTLKAERFQSKISKPKKYFKIVLKLQDFVSFFLAHRVNKQSIKIRVK